MSDVDATARLIVVAPVMPFKERSRWPKRGPNRVAGSLFHKALRATIESMPLWRMLVLPQEVQRWVPTREGVTL